MLYLKRMAHKDILLLVNVTATDDVYPTIIQYAREHGWRLTIEDRMAPPDGWRGDGVIAQATDAPAFSRYLQILRRKKIPVVTLTRARCAKNLASCLLDTPAASVLAAAHLKERGFTQAVCFSMEWVYGRKILADAFRNAWSGEFRNWIWPEEAPRLRINDRAAMVRWLKDRLRSAPRPLAVFCPNSYNAVMMLNICLDQNIAVPEEVAIISNCYDPAFCDCQAVPISGVEFNTRLHAREGAMLLDRLIDSDPYISARISIPPSGLVIQQSTDVLATEDPLLRQALRFIRENITRPFGAAEIADALKIPRIRLDRCFAAALRRSPGKEIVRQRIERARRLLAETDLTLDAVAADCGFCHASYLINTFKRKTGTTPHRFRCAQKEE